MSVLVLFVKFAQRFFNPQGHVTFALCKHHEQLTIQSTLNIFSQCVSMFTLIFSFLIKTMPYNVSESWGWASQCVNICICNTDYLKHDLRQRDRK